MLVFSEVLLFVGNKKLDYLQGGEVKDLDTVMNSTKAEKFLKKFPPGTEVHCESILYHYGEDILYDADDSEVSYFEKQKKEDINFLGIRAKCITASVFDECLTEELLLILRNKEKTKEKKEANNLD